jgi:ribosomal protein L37AE/L43A
MNVAVGKVLRPGLKCTYEYDFGSTTSLALRVVGERTGKASKQRVRLLARNEPPQVLCESCQKKPAAWVDVFNGGDWFCEECMEDTEEGALPWLTPHAPAFAVTPVISSRDEYGCLHIPRGPELGNKLGRVHSVI